MRPSGALLQRCLAVTFQLAVARTCALTFTLMAALASAPSATAQPLTDRELVWDTRVLAPDRARAWLLADPHLGL